MNLKKQRRPYRHFEDTLQEHCVIAFRMQWPDKIMFHCPNGGRRSLLEAIRLKRQGVVSGVPDLFVAAPSRSFNGLFIELKVGKNKMSDAQREMALKLQSFGYCVQVCRSVDEFIKAVKSYFGE